MSTTSNPIKYMQLWQAHVQELSQLGWNLSPSQQDDLHAHMAALNSLCEIAATNYYEEQVKEAKKQLPK